MSLNILNKMSEANNNPDRVSLKDRYELVINARNFHYENFNKWLTYFYVAIAAIFVAYYNVLAKENELDDSQAIEFLIILLGYVVSILWYWSAKGYYYWNIHFITMVNHYEKDLLNFNERKRVYFAFANKENQNDFIHPIRGANISTSKVAILFAFIISVFWGILLFEKGITYFYDCPQCKVIVVWFSIFLSPFSVIFFSWIFPKKFLSSDTSRMPDLHIEHPKWVDKTE